MPCSGCWALHGVKPNLKKKTQKQSKHKCSFACKKGRKEVRCFICEGYENEFKRKDELLTHERVHCIGEEKRKKMFVQLLEKNLAKQKTWLGINKSIKAKLWIQWM